MIQVHFHERLQQIISGVESKIVNQVLKKLELINLSDWVKNFERFKVQLVDLQVDEGKHSWLVKILLESLLDLLSWDLVVNDNSFVQKLQLVFCELILRYRWRLWLFIDGFLLLI
jgi:hypothetical protein